MALADYIYQKPVIETERLRIRPMSAADVPALEEWMVSASAAHEHREGGLRNGIYCRKKKPLLRCLPV